MKGPIGFGRVVNIVMNIILGLCMSLVMLTAAGVPLLPEIVIEAWFASFCIGYAFGDIIPVASWGPALCAKLNLRGGIGFYLINSVILGVYFGTIISFGNMLINNLPTLGWAAVFGSFVASWPLVALSAVVLVNTLFYMTVLVIIFLWLAQKIAKAISGFDPAAAAREAH